MMTVIKSNKKRKKGRHSLATISCYVLVVLILVIGVVSFVWHENESSEKKTSTLSQTVHHHHKKIKQKPLDIKTGIDGIINGDLHLISLSHGKVSTESSSSIPYSVSATFCKLDWSLHKSNPSSVPMNKDLIYQSHDCLRTEVTLNLYDVVSEARKYDESSRSNNDSQSVHTITPKGFVFHESRCGSTLVANSLAAFDPEKNRVYSESAPPISAAKMYTEMSEENSLQLLRDVVYLMGEFWMKFFFIVALSLNQ